MRTLFLENFIFLKLENENYLQLAGLNLSVWASSKKNGGTGNNTINRFRIFYGDCDIRLNASGIVAGLNILSLILITIISIRINERKDIVSSHLW